MARSSRRCILQVSVKATDLLSSKMHPWCILDNRKVPGQCLHIIARGGRLNRTAINSGSATVNTDRFAIAERAPAVRLPVYPRARARFLPVLGSSRWGVSSAGLDASFWSGLVWYLGRPQAGVRIAAQRSISSIDLSSIGHQLSQYIAALNCSQII